MITQARDQSTSMVEKAQQQKQAVLADLGRERDLLQKKIAELRLVRADDPGPAEVLPRVPAARPRGHGAGSPAARPEVAGQGESTAPDTSGPGQQDAQQD